MCNPRGHLLGTVWDSSVNLHRQSLGQAHSPLSLGTATHGKSIPQSCCLHQWERRASCISCYRCDMTSSHATLWQIAWDPVPQGWAWTPRQGQMLRFQSRDLNMLMMKERGMWEASLVTHRSVTKKRPSEPCSPRSSHLERHTQESR